MLPKDGSGKWSKGIRSIATFLGFQLNNKRKRPIDDDIDGNLNMLGDDVFKMNNNKRQRNVHHG